MSERRVAFLRGLNVGGHRMKMDVLRARFEALGFDAPATFIASGNVVYGSADAPAADEARVEAGLEDALGYGVPTFVRTLDDVAGLLDDGPISADELDGPDFAHYVLFLKAEPDDSIRDVFQGLDSERDSFRLRGREVHWLSRGRLSASPLFGGAFERATRDVPNTMRNSTTLRRLLTKFV